MTMLVDDDLIPPNVYPQCARVRPTHTIQSVQSLVDLDLETSFDFAAVSINTAAVVAGVWGVDDCGIRVNVVKIGHDWISCLV
jgi:hypothetical protein